MNPLFMWGRMIGIVILISGLGCNTSLPKTQIYQIKSNRGQIVFVPSSKNVYGATLHCKDFSSRESGVDSLLEQLGGFEITLSYRGLVRRVVNDSLEGDHIVYSPRGHATIYFFRDIRLRRGDTLRIEYDFGDVNKIDSLFITVGPRPNP